MRKITGILAAIFTFSLSVLIYFVFLSLSVDKSKSLVREVESSLLPTVSLCEAESFELFLSGDTLCIKGYLYTSENADYLEFYDFGNTCRITSAELMVWDDNNQFLTKNDLSAELQDLIKQLSELERELNSKDLSVLQKVEITGKLKKSEPPDFLGAGFYVNVKEIKQISPTVKVKVNLSDIIFREAKAKIIETQ
jgi:hypothetical protein